MARTLDFNKVKKQYLTVTLADEKETTLIIGTPTKAVMNDVLALQEALDGYDGEGTMSADAMDDLYRACARCMSRNKQGVHISPEFLEEIFDFEDIIIFFNAYVDFIGDIANEKN